MKNIKEIKKEILENEKLMRLKKTTYRKRISLSKRNKCLAEIIMYLETSPSEEFLRNQKSRMLKIISAKESQYGYWSSNVCPDRVGVKKTPLTI